MIPQLDPVSVRILGCLIEKETTTPEYYPLSLNALVNACNQKSNRDPVMSLSDVDVETGLEMLREKHFVWQRSVTGARVFKYEHNIKSIIPLSDGELAVLCVVMLRGAQTIGEIRARCDRQFQFATIEDAERTVKNMVARDDGPLLLELPRQPGRKEPRFVHLLCGEEWAAAQAAEAVNEVVDGAAGLTSGVSASERLRSLEEDVAALKEEVTTLRGELETIKLLLA